MNDLDTEEGIWNLALMTAVNRALRGTGFEPDPDPARGGSKVRGVENGAVLQVTVPVIDDTNPNAVLDVSVDRASLAEVVRAVRDRSENL